MERGATKMSPMPKKIRQGKRVFVRQPDGQRYVADDDGTTILDSAIVHALITGDGPTHGCTIDHSAGFVFGDGKFGGAGASGNIDGGTDSSGGYDSSGESDSDGDGDDGD